MIIFMIIVLLIYGLINGYVLWRGLQALSGLNIARLIFIIIFVVLILAFPAGRIINGQFRHRLSEVLVLFGAIYLALMIYLMMFLFLRDLVRWGVKILKMPLAEFSWLSVKSPSSFLTIVGLAVLVVFAGYFNAINPRLKVLEIGINKQVPAGTELKAVLISDIHLGIINRSNRLESLVSRINQLQPDLVFLAGDIVDEAVPPEEEEKMVDWLKKVDSRLGLYACPGNHEYYGGFNKNISYLEKAGVTVLLDRAVKVDDCLFVIGRRDRAAASFGENRLPLKEIIQKDNVDTSWPVVVLDHQPFHLNEAAEAGVDLQLSGHTHAGQLFPLNLINKFVYEINWGYLKKGDTHIYVTSGSGTWGPPVRTGSKSEIVLIKLSFSGDKEGGINRGQASNL